MHESDVVRDALDERPWDDGDYLPVLLPVMLRAGKATSGGRGCGIDGHGTGKSRSPCDISGVEGPRREKRGIRMKLSNLGSAVSTVRRSSDRRRSAPALAVTCVTALTTTLVGLSATTAEAATYKGAADVTAASWTPSIATSSSDGSVEQVRQLVPCNGTMYAVGRFTSMQRKGVTYQRNNAFSFSETTGAVTDWNPDVNGRVNSVAFSADCSTVYLGGSFTSVGGTPASNIAAVSAATGQVLPNFAASVNREVSTLVRTGGHLLVGGKFTAVNGRTGKKYFVSLDPSGGDDGYLNLNVSGKYIYTDQGGRASGHNATQVYNTSLSPDGTKLLVMGVFTSVGGQGRRQIFMLDLAATSASVNSWYSPEFDQNCHVVEPFWLQDASWSPDASTIYIVTTGYKPATDADPYVKTGYSTSEPRGGLCDAAAAFSSGPSSNQLHRWVNYTGCDSLYSTAADANHVYIGGHERWANNPVGCDSLGTGAVAAPGMGGLDPSTGQLNYNPTRGRGKGADDMLRTPAGLWIASDNAQNTAQCAGEGGHKGICFLPSDQL